MMKIEAKKLETFCSVVSALVQECHLTITKDGLTTRAVDAANVAMVQVLLPNTAFTEFTIEPGVIGMDVAKWKQALGVMKPDAVIAIDRPKEGRITMSDGGYDYKLTPLDPNTIRKQPNVPTFNLPNALTVDGKEFAEAIKALAVIGDKARLTIRGATLELSTEGDTDFLKKEIPGEPMTGKKNETAAASLFSLDYLREITKGASGMKGAEKIAISLGIDHPVRFDFDIGELSGSYVIAPRIETDGGAE
jgi:proliferating cell nuclear antigen